MFIVYNVITRFKINTLETFWNEKETRNILKIIKESRYHSKTDILENTEYDSNYESSHIKSYISFTIEMFMFIINTIKCHWNGNNWMGVVTKMLMCGIILYRLDK